MCRLGIWGWALLAVQPWLSVAGAASAPRPAPLASGPSVAGMWPRQPLAESLGTVPLQLTESTFEFSTVGHGIEGKLTPPRLQRAFERYKGIIFGQKTLWSNELQPEHSLPLHALSVRLSGAADLEAPPQLGDDESFQLSVSPAAATLDATTFSGLHRGLEAFAQICIRVGDATIINSTNTTVMGKPKFAYRGLMVDTARHWQPVKELLQLLDGMAASSLNVFHWHLTDSQSFPWNSSSQPKLVQGAYRPDLVYQRADLEAIVAYATDRAIRVIPEIGE